MHIDINSPQMQANPYPTYAKMRQADEPVQVDHRVAGNNAYFLTRYDDVKSVLKDPRFANDRRRLPDAEDWTKKWYIPGPLKIFGDSMALADAPDHTRLRNLVHKAFTPKMIHDLESNMQQMSHNLLDEAQGKPQIDFIADFALPLPLNVICDMMGVPQSDRPKMHRWMADTITDTSGGLLAKFPRLLNTLGLNRFLNKLIEDRRRHPQDDLTTALVQAEADGEKLSEDELLAMLFLILFAGHETTVNLIGSGTLALLQHPQQFEQLKQNRDMLDIAIEEMLRYTNPVQHIAMRYALEDVEVGGVHIPQQSTVMLGIAAANRDETIFENASAFDITRQPNPHIAFGFGIHYCLGAPLARLEAKTAFNVLLDRYPNLELAVPASQLEWRGAPALRGLKSFPVRLEAH